MNDPSDDPQLPESLKNELFRLYRVEVRSSADVDRAIVNGVRAHLARRRKMRILEIGLGIAAGVALFLAILPSFRVTDRGRYLGHLINNNQKHAGDVNGDGVVDIRDALILQGAIEGGMKKGVDLNQDGATDRKDVDAIAMLAVRIDVAPDGGAVR